MSPHSSTLRDICRGLVIGGASLVVLIPTVRWAQGPDRAEQPVSISMAASAPLAQAATVPDFGAVHPTANARELVEWIARTGDNAGMPFVLVDKPAARLHVFNASAHLEDSTPVLLGSAPGDDSVPDIGKRPVHLVQPHERTTPAGRFVGHLGHNLTGEDVVWVDYAAAVSMHRVRPTLVPAERRAERLASESIDDNRISYGCINVPAAFYDARLKPMFSTVQGIVYVLPEQKSLQQVFGIVPTTTPRASARVTRSAGFV